MPADHEDRLPIVQASSPVATGTALSRQHFATLAIGPRSCEQAMRAARRRLNELELGSERRVVTDGLELRALAGEVLAVRRVAAQTRADHGNDRQVRPARSDATTTYPPTAVSAAATVQRSCERRWGQIWADMGRSAPEPDALGAALRQDRWPDADERTGPDDHAVIDLRDRPDPLVLVEPFAGLGPRRTAQVFDLVTDLGDLVLAVVVADSSSVPSR